MSVVFYYRASLYASAVRAMALMSVRPSVCLSVTKRLSTASRKQRRTISKDSSFQHTNWASYVSKTGRRTTKNHGRGH